MPPDDVFPKLVRGDFFEGRVIQDVLGEGASGVVYRAFELYTQREVALKIIYNTLGSRFEQRAQHETAVQAKIQHPNVVIVYAGGITLDGSKAFIVMELVDGFSLRAILRGVEYVSIPEAIRIGIQVLQGADAAHQLNIVHRDLKPENIIIQAGNHVKLVDFGIAKFLGAHYNTTGKFRIAGTPMYMSPEQCRGEDATPQSDVYAVGVILFEALLGKHWVCIKNRNPSRDDFVKAHLFQQPAALSSLISGFPLILSDIVSCALLKNPRDRFESGLKMIEALQASESEVSQLCIERGLAPALRDLVGLTRGGPQKELAQGPAVVPSPFRALPATVSKSTIPNTPAAMRSLRPLSTEEPATTRPPLLARETVPHVPKAMRRTGGPVADPRPTASHIPSSVPRAASASLQLGASRISRVAPSSRGARPAHAPQDARRVAQPSGGARRNARPEYWEYLENTPFSKLAGVAIALGVLVAIPIGVSTGKSLVPASTATRLNPPHPFKWRVALPRPKWIGQRSCLKLRLSR